MTPDLAPLAAQLQTVGQARAVLAKADDVLAQAWTEGAKNVGPLDALAGVFQGLNDAIDRDRGEVGRVRDDLPSDDSEALTDQMRGRVQLACTHAVEDLEAAALTLTGNGRENDLGDLATGFAQSFGDVVDTVAQGAASAVNNIAKATWPALATAAAVLVLILVFKDKVL